MNFEENRLRTFNEWPQDAVVSPSRIAKAGFYSIRQNLTVECFSCHMKISEWNYGDQVMAKHRNLSPNCPFVLHPTTSGNVPIISTTSSSTATIVPSSSSSAAAAATAAATTSSNIDGNSENYKDEATRLGSFNDWPVSHIVTPQNLARAGFYYLKIGDNTKCAYCKGVVRAWEPGDDPDREHQRHFSDCPFVLTVIVPRLNSNRNNNNHNNIPNNGNGSEKDGCGGSSSSSGSSSNTFVNLNLVSNEDLHCLGVHTHKGPKKPSYSTLESRLKSFLRWPPDLIQTPDILAQAGFYYEGSGDGVRCFHCDGGLRHWDPQDDPWTEHARWFPRCSFVVLVKGQEFVNACSLETNMKSNLEELDQKSVPVKKKEVSLRELQEHMLSDVALSALSIGLNVERVQRAIREKLERTGRGYSQPDALVEAALNLQHEEEDSMAYDQQNDQQQQQQQHEQPTIRQVKNVVANVLDTLVTGCLLENDQKTEETQQIANDEIVVMAATVATTTTDRLKKTVSLEEENRLLKEARLCKICMDAEVGIVFLPCGHLTTCVNCAPNLEDCPVCRSAIKATVRTFLS